MFLRIIYTVVWLSIVCAVAPAFAEQSSAPKLLGTFGVWNAFTYTENGQPVCYMVTKTHEVKDKKLKRGPAWLTITHRPGENSKDVVSYTAGYNYKAASDVDVHIGKDSFNLFTQKDTAWSRDAMADHALASAIRKNASMTIAGAPAAYSKGSVTDTLDLKGAATAYGAIGKACGYPEEKKPPAAKKPPKTKVKSSKS